MSSVRPEVTREFALSWKNAYLGDFPGGMSAEQAISSYRANPNASAFKNLSAESRRLLQSYSDPNIRIYHSAGTVDRSAAIKNLALEHGITEPEAQRLAALAARDIRSPELAGMSAQQRASLLAAWRGGSPWEVAPKAVSEGKLVAVKTAEGKIVLTKLASTPELQKSKYTTQQKALTTLEQKGYIDPQTGGITSKAFTDPQVEQALFNVGLLGKSIATQRALMQALKGVPADEIRTKGLSANVAGKVYDLAKLRQTGVIKPVEGVSDKFEIDIDKAVNTGFDSKKLGNLGFLVDEKYFKKTTTQRVQPEQAIPTQYMVIDPDSGEFVNVTKESYEKHKGSAQEIASQRASLSYLAGIPGVALTGGKYNLAPAVVTGVPTAVMLNAGFTKAQIEQAKESTTLTEKPLSSDAFVARYFHEKGWELPTYMGGTFHRGVATQAEVAKHDTKLKEASLAYKEKYGTGEVLKSGGVKMASTLVSPARVMYPEVEAKDISAGEWALGAGQVALLTSPIWLPRVPGLGLRTPKHVTVRYAAVTEKGFPTTGRATGVPVKGFGEIPHLEGRLYEIPIGYTKEAPLSPKQFSQLGAKGYQPISSFRVAGESGEATTFITPAQALRAGEVWQLRGGVRVPPEAISPKGMNIPTSPGLTPPTTGRVITRTPVIAPSGSTVVSPSTATMTPEQVARLGAPAVAPVYVWYEATEAGLLPRWSPTPMPKAIPTVRIETQEIQQPIEVPIVTPASVQAPAPIEIIGPIVTPTITPVIKPVVGTTPSITPVSITDPAPVPVTNPIPYLPIITPPKTPVPILTTPTIDEPPPVTKIPPPPPILSTPKLPAPYSSTGYRKHGLHSTYVKYSQFIPELVVYLPTWEGLKPPSIGRNLWRKFGTLPEPVELLGEEEFEMTPFGRKTVREVTARVKLASGAQQTGLDYQPTIKRKTSIRKSKKNTRLPYTSYYLNHSLPPSNLSI